MSIDPRMTVAEIIRLHPAARVVLARHGLDTCCGGSHPLEFACAARKVALEDVLRAIEAEEAVAPPAAASAATAAHPAAGTAPAQAADAPGPEAGEGPVTLDMTVRDAIARHPATLAVFGRHGLMGCGGSQGPVEPIGWFAKVHHVDPARLLAELDEAVRGGAAVVAEQPISPAELARENLYRRFLKAALLFTFTGGTALGAWALIVMALQGHLGGMARGVIQMHGHYQLFGWVGLFVVGVAYHILPRLTAVPLPSYRMASWSFVLLTAGTVLRFAQALDPSPLRSAVLLGGGLMEFLGCAIFAWTVGRILALQGARPAPYKTYLALGTCWLLAAAGLNLAHAWWFSATGRFEVPAWLNIPYLSVFLVGFVTFWILGVSLRTLPVFMGLRPRPQAAAALALPLSLALLVLAIGEALFLRGGSDAARVAFGLGGLGVAACLAGFVLALGILSPWRDAPEPGADRGYEKFIRLSYAWLLLSALMLGTFSVLALLGRNMDHAYVGAYRHALTVGFITTIMVGMALRIVPVFRGVPLYSPALREASFWLLAVGNVTRVLFQSLSVPFGPSALRVAGISGVLELAALALFGFNLWKTMNTPTAEDLAAAAWRPPIAPETSVGALLQAYPALLPVFVGSGFAPLGNPVLRRTLAPGVSIAQACRMHGVDVERFLGLLRDAQAAHHL
jgi:hypothetical protein